MNLCWIPHLLILAAQTQVYHLNCSGQIQTRTQFRLVFIHKVSSELWSSASPSCSLTWLFFHFSYISSPDFFGQSSLESFKSNHNKKLFLSWLIQAAQWSPVTQTLHEKSWNWGDISWDISWAICQVIWQSWRLCRAQVIRYKDGSVLTKGWRGKGQAPAQPHRLCSGSGPARHERGTLHWIG